MKQPVFMYMVHWCGSINVVYACCFCVSVSFIYLFSVCLYVSCTAGSQGAAACPQVAMSEERQSFLELSEKQPVTLKLSLESVNLISPVSL